MAGKGVTLSSYDPSLRDKIAWFFGDMFPENRSMRNWAQGAARGSVDLAPVVGDAVGFDEAKRDFQEGNYGKAALGGGLSLVGSVPGLGDALAGGAKAMIAGPMSKVWNEEMHSKAMDMAGERVDPDKIWKETGNFFDWASRGWRQEIDDAGSKFNVDALNSIERDGEVLPLSEVWDHPKLMEAYPSIGEVAVVPSDGPGWLGMYDPNHFRPGDEDRYPAISLNPVGIADYENGGNINQTLMQMMNSTSGDPMRDIIQKHKDGINSTLLHEGQHGIQDIEGWLGRGSSPDTQQKMIGNTESLYRQLLVDGIKTHPAFVGFDALPDDAIINWFRQGAMNPYKESVAKRAGQKAYERDAGEIQSRMVQNRRNLSLPTRQSVRPDSPIFMESPWRDQTIQGILAPRFWNYNGFP